MPQSKKRNKRAIISGGCGFVGRALAEELLAKGWEVLVVDFPQAESLLPKKEGLSFAAAPFFAQNEKPYDVFYHFAWAGSAGKGRADASLQAENIRQSVAYVKQAAAAGCRRFVFAGSIMQEEQKAASDAGKPFLPWDCYALAKQTAEKLTQIQAQALHMEFLCGVITNTYGVGERSDRLICGTLKRIARKEPLLFTEGKQWYDFIYITDLAAAFAALGEKGTDGKRYVIGSGQAKPLRQWLEQMLSCMGAAASFSLPFDGVSLPKETFDTTALQEETGFSCRVPFTEGIRATAKWLKEEER